ncbi:MAG: prepilin-type N-terminal cleavage/methylation domain-containing protein [Bacilli bacterium]
MRVFKIKNNKAYTIIEVLAVIVIIGVILVLTFPLITNAIIKSKYRYYESQENTLLLAGKDYFTTERVRLPKVNNEERTINLNTLINDGYTKPILDTNKDACNQEETIVTVKRFDKGEYRYYVRLVCNDYDTEDMWEWSDYVFYDPPYDSEYEMEIRYNYQKATAFTEVEPSEWEDLTEGKEYVSDIKFVANRFPEGEEIELSPKPEPRTVYSYKDQQWKWYNEKINETRISKSKPKKPKGANWVQGDPAMWEWAITECASKSPGANYKQGVACQWNWTKTSSCLTNPPDSSYKAGDECQWKWTRIICQKNNPGGYEQGSECGYTTETSGCVASKAGYTKGNACGWRTETSSCRSTNPGGWTQGSICARNKIVCVPGYDCFGCWQNTDVCIERKGSPDSGCVKRCKHECLDTTIKCKNYCNDVCRPCVKWKQVWNTCCDNFYNSCKSTKTECTLGTTSGTPCQWKYTRQVENKWYFSKKVPNAWNWTHTTGCQANPSNSDYTKGKACQWKWTKTLCRPSTPGTDYKQGTACQWEWTATKCASKSPGANYEQGDACQWEWHDIIKEYADGYHSTAPTISGVKYQTKDTTQSQWIGPYLTNRWQTTEPEAKLDYRKRYSKDQIRYYSRHATWGGIELKEWLTKEGLEEHFQDHYGKTIEQMQAISCDDIETEVCYNIVATPMYRYRIKLF